MKDMSIQNIGMIGAGAMGTGIAQVAANAGHDVFIYDKEEASILTSQTRIQRILHKLVEKGKLSNREAKALFGRLYYVNSLEGLSDCQLVIEAVVERLDVKKTIFQTLEGIVPSETILATNTSSLPVTAIASACSYPGRVIGLHFFNPAPLMALVEVVPAIQTDPGLVKICSKLMANWGKDIVVAKDTPGFIVNRIARPFYSEALRIHEEGLASIPTIDTAMTELGGFRMGPFALMDYIGHDVNYMVTETVWKAFHHEARYKPSFAQKQLVDAGYLGRKAGRGFYNYSDEDVPKEVADRSQLQSVFDRILVMLINEAADAAYYNIASAEEIDLAMTKGVNYPKGLLEWGREIGFKKCVERLDNLYNFYHEERYRASAYLRRQIQ